MTHLFWELQASNSITEMLTAGRMATNHGTPPAGGIRDTQPLTGVNTDLGGHMLSATESPVPTAWAHTTHEQGTSLPTRSLQAAMCPGRAFKGTSGPPCAVLSFRASRLS